MSLFLHKKQKLGDYSIGSSRNSRKNRNRNRKRNRKRMNKKPAGGASESKKMESPRISFFDDDDIEDYLEKLGNYNGANGAVADDEQIAFQLALFDSVQFHSEKNSRGKQVLSCCVTSGSIGKSKSKYEKGEPSCIYCVICDDAKPPNTLKRGSSCDHCYCEECIRNYIKEQINDDIEQVKCPVSNCKNSLNLVSLMPRDFLDRVGDVIRETEILASRRIIECPFVGCTGELVDDRKQFLIRACPKCWKIFCVRCRDSWHMGVSCATYQHNLYLERQQRLFWAKLTYCNDDNDEEEDPMLIPLIIDRL